MGLGMVGCHHKDGDFEALLVNEAFGKLEDRDQVSHARACKES